MAGLETRIGTVTVRTPLIAVSGVFGIGYHALSPRLPGLGAVVTKSITLYPKVGNPEPRIVETPAGLLNSIGLQNTGIKGFLKDRLPELRALEVPVIASVAGAGIEEYVECSSLLAPRDEIEAIELNVSCPNVKRGGAEFGSDPQVLRRLVARVKQVVGDKTVIVKLTPNVTDIALPAQAAVDGGADAISLINTLRGMAIDLNTMRPKLGNRAGGLSGRSIHPVAVYMVYRCYTCCCRANGVPIIGIGGVSSGEEALELILAGATCVGIGTAMFRDESVFKKVAQYLSDYVGGKAKRSLSDLVGKATR